VGRAMSSNEDDAYEIMRKLDVDYVLVIFGGVSGYSSDDINKFLWMVCGWVGRCCVDVSSTVWACVACQDRGLGSPRSARTCSGQCRRCHVPRVPSAPPQCVRVPRKALSQPLVSVGPRQVRIGLKTLRCHHPHGIP
jgi:hypothetical protein